MTHQSFSLIFLIALFPTAFSGIPLDRFFPYRTTHGDTEIEEGDDTGSPVLQTAETANRTRRQTEAHENWRNVSNSVKVPPMCPPLNHPKNGRCVSFRFLEDGEARCRCFPGFEFPKSNNRDEIRDKFVQKMRCQSSDAESTDESDNVKSLSWIPEKVTDCEPEKPEEEREGGFKWKITFIPDAGRSEIRDSPQRKPQETGRHVSNNAPMCLPLVNPKNGYCMAKYHFEGD
ncbi:hypothetical protein Ddc_10529 [Ditylenchus destructor]|nr:hypothetical protein Ddc_10529 [Ditylenchus destructor]